MLLLTGLEKCGSAHGERQFNLKIVCLISLTENDIICTTFRDEKDSQYGTLFQSALEAAH